MLIEKTKPTKHRLGWKENYVGWAYCSPIIIGILVFSLFPIILSIYSMFLDWNSYQTIWEAESVGLDNFRRLFSVKLERDRLFKSMGNTFTMMVQLPISLLLGVLLALAMNRKMPGAKVFRVLYYLPCITSVVAVTILFQKLFETDGTINLLLEKFGKKEHYKWLTDDVGIKVVVNILLIWKGLGYSTLMYLAGLQSVSTDQIEAAKIDGATGAQIFRKITLPALYPITFYLLVTGVMGGLQIFNEPYILAPGGYGSGNNAMTSASLIYFYYEKTPGLAAIAAWVLALMVFIVTFIQVFVDNKKEKY